GRAVQIPRHPPEGVTPLDTGEDFLALGEGQAPTAGQLGDEGRYHPASLTEPISPNVRIEAQRRRRRPAHHPRTHQQPALPPHLTASHYPRTHHTPLLHLRVLRRLLEPELPHKGGGKWDQLITALRRARCRATLARFPQLLMLHHFRLPVREVSLNTHRHCGFSHMRSRDVSPWISSRAIASASRAMAPSTGSPWWRWSRETPSGAGT